MADEELEKLLKELSEEEISSEKTSSPENEDDFSAEKRTTEIENQEKRSLDEEKIKNLLRRLRDEIKLSRKKLFEKDVEIAIAKYPEVADYKNEIANYLRKGLTIEEAIGAILAKEKKISPEGKEITKEAYGTSPSLIEIEKPKEKKIEEMTPEEKYQKLKELEERGEISFF